MNNPVILGIETSGILCSVAWCQNDKILLEYNIEKRNAHGTLLANLVEDGLKKLKLSPNSIDLVAVGSGPGSFTGLRIGMAYAKGFCMGLDVPLIPVTNFEVLAFPFQNWDGPVLALVEARKGYYYVGKFIGGILQPDSQALSEGSKLIENSDLNSLFIVHEENTNGKFRELASDSVHVEQGKYRASVICALGYQKHRKNEVIDLAEIEPLYLQPFAGVL